MSIIPTERPDEQADESHPERLQPGNAFCPMPSPLSGDLDEIYAYMLLIGDRPRRNTGSSPQPR